jgi:hypothetical protein
MTDPPPSPPADEPLVPLEPAQPDPAAEWPGFPPQQHDTPVPWATGFHETPADAGPAPPPAEPEYSRLRMWIAVGVGLQVLALLLWAYLVL